MSMSLFSVNHLITFIVLFFTVSPRSSEEIDRLSEVKNLTARLYSQLNVEEHQLRRERDTIQRLEEYKRQIAPMELVTWLLHYLQPFVYKLTLSSGLIQ